MMIFNPVLSGTLSEVIQTIVVKHDDPIAAELLYIHKLVKEYNDHWTQLPESVADLAADTIKQHLTGEVSMLAMRISDNDNDYEVSFLPKDKEPIYNGETWSRKNRQTGKIGKIVKKLLVREFKTKEWEDFSNRYKSAKCCCNKFELVSGEDIRHWYNIDNYYRSSGTLGNSCMKYYECSSYFDLYVDHAKMLISLKDGQLTGRAIVWEMEDGIVLLDRIYTCFDYLENCFIEYAKDHGWWIRECNSLLHTGDNQGWLTPDDDYSCTVYKNFEIKVKNYEQWPYVDSFRYYNMEKGTISTIYECGTASLDATDGGYSGYTPYYCDACGAVFYADEDDMPDELVYSDYEDRYLCEDCRWYSEGIQDYVSNSDLPISVRNEFGWEDYPTTYVNDNIQRDCFDGNESSDTIVCINGSYYFVNSGCVDFNEKIKMYEVRSDSR